MTENLPIESDRRRSLHGSARAVMGGDAGVRSGRRFLYEPDVVYPPGETLAEWLDEHGVSLAGLAAEACLSAEYVNQIVSGAAPVTAQAALGLERVTRVPAEFWNNLEMGYRAYLARSAG